MGRPSRFNLILLQGVVAKYMRIDPFLRVIARQREARVTLA
jgi:hypothetical protein